MSSETYSTRIGIIGSEGHLGSIIKDRLSYVYPNVWGINRTRWNTISEAKHFIRSMDIIIVCVRPADIEKVMHTIRQIAHYKPIISFAAGVPYEKYNYPYLYRAMTNVAAKQGNANTMIMYPPEADNKIMEDRVLPIIKELGTVTKISHENEDWLNVHTILAGSGIAFVAYLEKIFVTWALEQGLDHNITNEIISQLFYSTASLTDPRLLPKGEGMSDTDMIQQLIDSVATRGGTTWAGLEVLEGNNPLTETSPGSNLETLLHDALNIALQRCRNL
jgi:pyrroline-5-carboxylate reductase